MNELIGYIIIVLGLVFDFLGCLGLLRLPDLHNRLQASTKCVTLGTCGIMIGIFVIHGFSAIGMKAVFCVIFLLYAAPVSAHAIARAAHIAGYKLWEGTVCDKYAEDRKKQE